MKQTNKIKTLFARTVDIFAENRYIPKTLLRYRARNRKRFLGPLIQPGGIGAEIGVQKGFFTHGLLDCTKPSTLHLIDPWYLIGEEWPWAYTNKSTTKALQNIIYWFKKELSEGSIAIHIGFDHDVLLSFNDYYFDWVYLDTTHLYEDTKKELELLSKKVKINGIIAGDDWFSDPNHPFYGQYEAINEFVADNSYRIIASSDENNQWAIGRVLS